ncbi:hypothetical protein ACI78T_05465 [Blastococcus sp. SYSU D00922]
MDGHRRTLRAVLAVVLAVVVAGCTAPDRTTERPAAPGSTTAAVTALSGVLLQFRRDVARGRVEVRLTASAPDLAVDELELVAPGLTAEPGDPRGAVLRPGAGVDFPVVVGGDCAVAAGPPTAIVRLRDGTGVAREVTVPLEDDGLVGRLHEGLCFEETLLRQVEFEVADLREADGPALRAAVRVRRVGGDEPVRITRVDPNTVYDITPVGRLPALDGDGAVTAVLRLVPARCDVHALGESYRTGLIGLVVELGDEEPRSFVLTPDPAVRQRIEAFAVETCREGAG